LGAFDDNRIFFLKLKITQAVPAFFVSAAGTGVSVACNREARRLRGLLRIHRKACGVSILLLDRGSLPGL